MKKKNSKFFWFIALLIAWLAGGLIGEIIQEAHIPTCPQTFGGSCMNRTADYYLYCAVYGPSQALNGDYWTIVMFILILVGVYLWRKR